jgi:hypothetical protein
MSTSSVHTAKNRTESTGDDATEGGVSPALMVSRAITLLPIEACGEPQAFPLHDKAIGKSFPCTIGHWQVFPLHD